MDDYEEIEPRVRKSQSKNRCFFCLATFWFLATFLTIIACFFTWIITLKCSKSGTVNNDASDLNCSGTDPTINYISGGIQAVAVIGMFPAVIGLCPGGSRAKTVMGLLRRACAGERHLCVTCCGTACGCFLSMIVGSALGPLQFVSAALMTYQAFCSNNHIVFGAVAGMNYCASVLAFVVSFSLCIAYALQRQR